MSDASDPQFIALQDAQRVQHDVSMHLRRLQEYIKQGKMLDASSEATAAAAYLDGLALRLHHPELREE